MARITELEASINTIVSRIKVIPPSRNFWVNRTFGGLHYKEFVSRGIIGLDINEISASQLSKIRIENALNSRQVNYLKVQTDVKAFVKNVHAKEIRETVDKKKRQHLEMKYSLRANQVYKFAFEMKPGDYVVVPSANSVLVTIGHVKDPDLVEGKYLPLQRTVEWIATFEKDKLDPNLYKAFSSQGTLFSISKYKDVILRTLYDFYFEGDEGNLVLNLGGDGKIPLVDEAKFIYFFSELFESYLTKNNLPYNIRDIGTIVNLNSKGKRKLFGRKELALTAGLFITIALEGDSLQPEKYGPEVNAIVSSIEDHLNTGSRGINGRDLKEAAKEMKVDEQAFFKKVLDASNREYDSLKENQKKVNGYY